MDLGLAMLIVAACVFVTSFIYGFIMILMFAFPEISYLLAPACCRHSCCLQAATPACCM